MSEEVSDWPEYRDLVVADTKSLTEMMDNLGGALRRAVLKYEEAAQGDEEVLSLLLRHQKLVKDRLRGLVIDNSRLRAFPDCAEVYLLRAFKAQVEAMIWVLEGGAQELDRA